MNQAQRLGFVFWTLLALASSYLSLRPILGTTQVFTAFEFIGPLGGSLFGALVGAFAAITAKGIGFWLTGGALTAFALVRLLTPAAAAIYLTGKQRWILSIPALAMLAFWLHPVGREVWYFALYWLIPFVAWHFRDHSFSRALGATFTAHALGGAAFIWLVPTTATLWQDLIPVVAFERLTFAAGMTAALIAFEYGFSRLPRLAKRLGVISAPIQA